MTSVPKPIFGPNGFVAPSESDIRAGVFTDLNDAFGGDLNPAPETPQGQISVTLAAVIGFCNDTFLNITNQVDPAYADGRMQDAIARIYFLERNPAEPTVVTATCGGAAGTVIPVGALAKTADGTTYSCTTEGTIPALGTIDLPFQSIVPGPIPCVPGSLNTIYRAIPGWDSITNATDGVLGRNVESRAEFEARRAASVALNALGVLPAIRATVLNVPNVLDVYATENPTGAPAVIGGVTIAAHSLYVAVAGGNSDDIAKAIWSKKNPGCGYTGTTTVVVTDDNSGYSPPYPTYNVKFTIPDETAIYFDVKIANSVTVPANAEDLIRQAIVTAFSGSDGGSRAGIGSTIYASRYYAPVANLGSWAQIVSIKIGLSGPGALDELTLDIDQIPTINPVDITVTAI